MEVTEDQAVKPAEQVAPDSRAFDLFVIHAAADLDFVRGYLVPALNVPPARVLLIDALQLGADAVSEIDRAVSRSRFTIAVLSPAFLADRWAVFGEQLASYASVEDPRVIPLRLTDCQIPLHLGALISLDFTERRDWESEAARLRNLLDRPAPVPEQIACPYPGMRPFEERQAGQFFGRDQEIDDLVGRLDRGEREIYLIGPSGSGKSSLVYAGLFHVLDQGTSRLSRSFVVRSMRPGEQPADRLARVLEGDVAAPAAAIDARSEAKPAGDKPSRGIDAVLARCPPAERVLVFIDQLDELFTVTGAAERQRFIDALRGLRAEPRCHLLLALRADFYGSLMESALWPERSTIARLDLAPLRGARLAQAIATPAERVGVYLETRLCDRLVADAADEPGALPLVQETLRLLWDKRDQRYIGLAHYEALGDVLGHGGRGLDLAIASRANTMMDGLTAAQQTLARRILLRLVSFGEGRADTRRQQDVTALRSAAEDDAEFARVLQQLVDNRLVTLDGGAADHGALADLSHEAVITAWPVLRAWIGRRRADEQRRRRIEAKVGEWIERGRGIASLLEPVELAEAEQWMQSDAAQELGYGTELPALVAASRRELERTERQQRRRRVRALAVLTAFSLVASILALVAWQKRQEAQQRAVEARLSGERAEQQARDKQHLLGMNYMEQGRVLLLAGHAMQALPYFVAARAEMPEMTETIDSPILQMLFAQSSQHLPLVTFAGHTAAIDSAVFSPDGTRVATAGFDNTARLWNATTGKPLTAPLPHHGSVNKVVFSPDGARVVTASADGTARVWDAATGKPVTAPLQHRSTVYAAAFSPDGTRVVTASEDQTARVWNATTGEVIATLEHDGVIGNAAFSRDGTRIVTTGITARVWNAATGAPVTAVFEHDDVVRAAAFSPDGTRVVTGSADATARIWDASTGKALTRPLEHNSEVLVAVFSPDGARVATASTDGTARVWNATTGRSVTGALKHDGVVRGIAFSPDGTQVVTAGGDHMVRVWDATTGALVIEPLEHQDAVYSVTFSPDGTRVLAAGYDRIARIWDVRAAGPPVASFKHQSQVAAAAFSPDGTRLVTMSWDDHTARVWDAASARPLTAPLEHRSRVRAAAFSPDGTRVITGSGDGTARVWNAITGVAVTAPLEHRGGVIAVAFGADGTRVVTADEGSARVWDATTGHLIAEPLTFGSPVEAVAFSADRTRLATATEDGTARVWDVTTGQPVTAPLEHREAVMFVGFSPDGTRVLTASIDQTARVWSATTGKPVTAPLLHQGSIYHAAFSPDGTRVVTASWDRTARVWDAATGKPVTAPLEHGGYVNDAAFSADGKRVVTACSDGARVWDATTGKLVTLLRHEVGVRTAVFSPDGTKVLTASYPALLWTLAMDHGSLEDWRARAACAPFILVNNVVVPNPDPPSVCLALTGPARR